MPHTVLSIETTGDKSTKKDGWCDGVKSHLTHLKEDSNMSQGMKVKILNWSFGIQSFYGSPKKKKKIISW